MINWSLVLIGSGVTALATSVGALPTLILHRLSARANNFLLGFSAGVMLSASSFSLIIPAMEMATKQSGGDKVSGALLASTAILVGALFLFLCNRYIPHEHFEHGREGAFSGIQLKRIWLFVFAVALHNFPEGLAVGSAVSTDDLKLAMPVLVGIGLQDLPEGFVVAAALRSVGYSAWKSIGVAVLTGIFEALAALVGFLVTSNLASLLPWALAFAGGAMLYVVINEMIPEMKENRGMEEASAGLILGFVLMMFLDTALA